jgi:hypothetical protein
MRGCGWQVEDENGNGVEMGLIVIHVWSGGFTSGLAQGEGALRHRPGRHRAPQHRVGFAFASVVQPRHIVTVGRHYKAVYGSGRM